MLAASVLAACEKPKDEVTEKDVAPPALEEVTTEETIVVSPTVSEDAPKLPHKGEPPSPNQPQPVVPEEPAAEPEGPAAEADEPAAAAEEEAVIEGVTVTSPMVSEDAPKLPHKGEPPSPNQPQPVYPDSADAGEPAGVAEEDTVMEGVTVTSPMVSEDAPKLPHKGEPPSPNQPQPVYPDSAEADEPAAAAEEDTVMEGVTVTSPMVSEDAPKLPHKGEPPSPNQPQPVYPDGADAGEPAALIVEEAEAVMTTPEGKTVVISEDHVTIVVPPMVSEDAPRAPHKGEPPSPNQPQPVYPDGL